MKIQFLMLCLFLTIFSSQSTAQSNTKQDTLLVNGVCGMCKERIEEAASGKGVKYVSWDNVTDQLIVAYRTDKTTLEEIEERVVQAGHSTENKRVSSESYESLPACCRYEELHDH